MAGQTASDDDADGGDAERERQTSFMLCRVETGSQSCGHQSHLPHLVRIISTVIIVSCRIYNNHNETIRAFTSSFYPPFTKMKKTKNIRQLQFAWMKLHCLLPEVTETYFLFLFLFLEFVCDQVYQSPPPITGDLSIASLRITLRRVQVIFSPCNGAHVPSRERVTLRWVGGDSWGPPL